MSPFLAKFHEIYRIQVFILLYKHKYIIIYFIPLRLKNLLPYPSQHQYAIDLKPVFQSWGVKYVFMSVTVWERFSIDNYVLRCCEFHYSKTISCRLPFLDVGSQIVLSVLSRGILWVKFSYGTNSSNGIKLIITFTSIISRSLRIVISHQWALRIIHTLSLTSYAKSTTGISLLCT
jgi:hypothetical protein